MKWYLGSIVIFCSTVTRMANQPTIKIDKFTGCHSESSFHWCSEIHSLTLFVLVLYYKVPRYHIYTNILQLSESSSKEKEFLTYIVYDNVWICNIHFNMTLLYIQNHIIGWAIRSMKLFEENNFKKVINQL